MVDSIIMVTILFYNGDNKDCNNMIVIISMLRTVKIMKNKDATNSNYVIL